MTPEHDPQVLVAREHLRPHLTAILDAVDMPEPTRTKAVEALLAAGDISRDARPEIVGEAPVLMRYATLTIRRAYPAHTTAEVAR